MPRLRLRLILPVALALAAVTAAPLHAQKSTIQGSRGGGGGGSLRGAGSSGGGGISRPAPSRPSGGAISRGGRSTVSPDFPRKGRDERASVSRPATGGRSTLSRPSRGSATLGRVRVDGDHDKRYLRGSSRGERSWVGDRWRHSRRGRTIVIRDSFWYDPYWYDPFLRYRYYDRWRYAYGFGCGFYDRFWWRGRGWRSSPYGYDPCFSSFSVAFGHPWFHDPWPGFWSWGWYGTGNSYGDSRDDDGWENGYEEGYSRGYREGREEGAPDVDYGLDLAPYEDAPSAGMPVAPEVRRHLATGRYAEALSELDGLLDEYPDDPAAHLTRGITLAALGHYGEAAEALRDGLEAGGPARLAIDAPALFPSRAEFRRTLNELEAFVRTHADSRDARFTLGALYLFSGEVDSGRAILRGLGDDAHALDLLERTTVTG